MKKKILKILGLSLVLLALLAVVAPSIPAQAADFYAKGLGFQAYDELKYLKGKISTVYAISEKSGMAGVEWDIDVKTSTGQVTVEIINWYYGTGLPKVGFVIYKNGQYVAAQRVPAQFGEVYSWRVDVYRSGCIAVEVRNAQQGIVASHFRSYGALHITEAIFYVEYWRYSGAGTGRFYYYGWASITNVSQLQYRPDKTYKSAGLDFGFYLVHRNWDGITDKGEVDDR